jgi:hypothetical protein
MGIGQIHDVTSLIPETTNKQTQTNKQTNKRTNSGALVRKRNIPTERPPLVDEI